MAYAIPDFTRERAPSDDHLKRLMSEFVVEVAHSANMVVLRTPPGSAHVVASALDRASLGDVLGTVAGDDTVLVIARDPAGGDPLARALLRLAERHPARRPGGDDRDQSGMQDSQDGTGT